MSETRIVRDVLRLGVGAVRLFRNNVGMAWQGKLSRPVDQGDYFDGVRLKGARAIHFGLCEGSSDVIGWTRVVVTPDMVGKPVAIFTAIETKRPAAGKRQAGRATIEQARFVKRVLEDGGRAGFAQTVDDAKQIIRGRGYAN
jgi:hypothetical protein